MAEPLVSYPLKLPVDLNAQVRALAKPQQINQTLVDLLREALAARLERKD